MNKKWIYPPEPDEETIDRLSQDINTSPVISKILANRGINTFEAAKEYFRPSLNYLHDPFLLKDMYLAVERINEAINNNEKILVYGDYDVDGTTSVTLVYGFLKHFHAQINYYIPDRYKEGYGISKDGIDFAIEHGYSLIITLDCGIKAVSMSKYAEKNKIDMIICDHHLPGNELPRACAVIDPKQKDCTYPFKELAGCGLGFKLIQAFCIKNHYDPDFLNEYLDLVTISIASDIVPIIGENRILAYHGLKILNDHPRPGIQAIMDLAGLREEVNISNIVFGIGPRINASGRMDHAKSAVELLLAENLNDAKEMAAGLDAHNINRRTFDFEITTEAIQMIEENDLFKKAKSTVLFKDSWHKGVIGIVASRCLDKYYRPTIILTESNGKATGSARSVMGFDVYKAISECADLLEQYGGHMYAAGLTMDIKNINAFRKRFEEVVNKTIKDDQLVPQIEIDSEIDFDSINFKFYNILAQMGPYGPGNMQPVFVSHGLKISGYPRVLKEQHLKFSVYQEDNEDIVFDAIAFGMAQYSDLVGSGMRFSMAYYIEENNYMGNKTLQLRVKDIKFD